MSSKKKVPDQTTVTVFHAGSLSVPLKSVAAAFEQENPGVKVNLEAAGSIACIRKITELHRECDVLALADYKLIDEMIIPDYAKWNIRFASNELCIVYTGESKDAGEISRDNWYKVLMDPEVRYGRSDPNSDPCGYRTLLAFRLAQGILPAGFDRTGLEGKDTRFIRGKETDLNSLLESRTIDYMFNYLSVAIQHGFKYLRLPDSINLSDPALEKWYSTAEVTVRGATPGSVSIQHGAPIIYGVTIPEQAPNKAMAEKFVRFLLDPAKGLAIFKASGQNPLIPKYSGKSVPAAKMF